MWPGCRKGLTVVMYLIVNVKVECKRQALALDQRLDSLLVREKKDSIVTIPGVHAAQFPVCQVLD